ncbi:hypothetical protein GE061_004970 [Apolygus lucorum]|uniref:Uncharacterized protein n=1 Tax=Apolygus lucorum TaxID=248454 RepID=A0A8S9WV04_APOLU|nr:hypothetical protein GE061_004970 [Apolygus lucorum]
MDRLEKERSAVGLAFSRIRKTFEDEFKNEDRSFDVLQPMFVQLDHCTMNSTNDLYHWKYRWKKVLQSCCQWCNRPVLFAGGPQFGGLQGEKRPSLLCSKCIQKTNCLRWATLGGS